MFKIALLVLCASSWFSSKVITSQVINQNVDRVIDLKSQLVIITTTMTLVNTGNQAVGNFHILPEKHQRGQISYISITDPKKELEFNATFLEDRKESAYIVHLKQSLEPGESAIIKMEITYSKTLQPYPSSITQEEPQLVRYFGNSYFYSPYRTNKQTTRVELSSDKVESYSELDPVLLNGSTLIYGAYEDIDAFSEVSLMVHFELKSRLLTITRLERIIRISHWGTIDVEDTIELLHTGPKLKGQFSRLDSRTYYPSVIYGYHSFLPTSAEDIQLYDVNGNVSSSHIRYHSNYIEMNVRQRFLLFGGWKSSYTLAYKVPVYQYLYTQSNTEYTLNMRLLDHVFDNMYIDELETSIVFPFGAESITLSTPYEVQIVSDEYNNKNFDRSGRTVIKLRKTNLVEKHIQDFQVTYHRQIFWIFLEPIVWSIAVNLLFILAAVYFRIDLAIHKLKPY